MFLGEVVANATDQPAMALRQDEAQMLGKATVDLMAEFGMKPSPKQQALVNFALASGSVLGPRVFMLINPPKPQTVNMTVPMAAPQQGEQRVN